MTGACVGHLETDGVEHYLNVTEKRNRKRRKILLDDVRPILAYVARAGIRDDREGPLFRPEEPGGASVLIIALAVWRKVVDHRQSAEVGFDHHLTTPADSEPLRKLLDQAR